MFSSGSRGAAGTGAERVRGRDPSAGRQPMPFVLHKCRCLASRQGKNSAALPPTLPAFVSWELHLIRVCGVVTHRGRAKLAAAGDSRSGADTTFWPLDSHVITEPGACAHPACGGVASSAWGALLVGVRRMDAEAAGVWRAHTPRAARRPTQFAAAPIFSPRAAHYPAWALRLCFRDGRPASLQGQQRGWPELLEGGAGVGSQSGWCTQHHGWGLGWFCSRALARTRSFATHCFDCHMRRSCFVDQERRGLTGPCHPGVRRLSSLLGVQWHCGGHDAHQLQGDTHMHCFPSVTLLVCTSCPPRTSSNSIRSGYRCSILYIIHIHNIHGMSAQSGFDLMQTLHFPRPHTAAAMRQHHHLLRARLTPSCSCTAVFPHKHCIWLHMHGMVPCIYTHIPPDP